MPREDQFPEIPPIRFDLNAEQIAQIESARPIGAKSMILGYADRHRWPQPDRFTLCAWFVSTPQIEDALVATKIMARKAPKKQPMKTKAKP